MQVNGKFYPMWGQFVEKKENWIGGKLREYDDIAGEVETTITDITMEPNGEDSAMFVIKGEKFDMRCDVTCLGIGGGDGDGLHLSTPFGTSWRLTQP